MTKLELIEALHDVPNESLVVVQVTKKFALNIDRVVIHKSQSGKIFAEIMLLKR